MGGWADGRMGGWADGRMGGWADGRMGDPRLPHESQEVKEIRWVTSFSGKDDVGTKYFGYADMAGWRIVTEWFRTNDSPHGRSAINWHFLAYRLTERFPNNERFGLVSQIRCAAYSAAFNIAEGSSKRGAREFRRFLDISLAPLNELHYAFRLSHDLGILRAEHWNQFCESQATAGRLTWGLYRSISKRCT